MAFAKTGLLGITAPIFRGDRIHAFKNSSMSQFIRRKLSEKAGVLQKVCSQFDIFTSC